MYFQVGVRYTADEVTNGGVARGVCVGGCGRVSLQGIVMVISVQSFSDTAFFARKPSKSVHP